MRRPAATIWRLPRRARAVGCGTLVGAAGLKRTRAASLASSQGQSERGVRYAAYLPPRPHGRANRRPRLGVPAEVAALRAFRHSPTDVRVDRVSSSPWGEASRSPMAYPGGRWSAARAMTEQAFMHSPY